MYTLGIETSCDETAAAVVRDDGYVLSSVIATQIDLFAGIGGVVPEMAARAHTEKILPVIDEALRVSGRSWEGIDRIAVTEGPGLIGSLLVGQCTARSLAYARGKPLTWVDHLHAHLMSVLLWDDSSQEKTIDFPAIGLLVSGGHTELLYMKSTVEWDVIGQTRDDAAGEAFDKVGRLLGLPYPGGPSVSKAAVHGDAGRFTFPRARLEPGSLDFSFSGLKTAVLREVKIFEASTSVHNDSDRTKFISDIAASFQRAVIDILVSKAASAVAQFSRGKSQIKSVILAGGVAANQALRGAMQEQFGEKLYVPASKFCTDNAAMVGRVTANAKNSSSSMTR